MKVLLRLLSVVLLLGAVFMTAVVITALTSDGTLIVGRFIGFLVGTALLYALAVVAWRKSSTVEGPTPAAP
jgi:Na+-translocating ferredoxin:NAD+ oxidoreductase RnfD subunit